MKNEKVMKINKLGKILRIIANVCKGILIAGVVVCIIGGIVCLQIPNDAVTVEGKADGAITVDNSKVPPFIELLDLEETNFHIEEFGIDVLWNIEKTETKDDVTEYAIKGNVENVTGREVKLATAVACLAGAMLCAYYIVIMAFGSKLAKALETCGSPFEENIIKRMKYFAYSLMPLVHVNTGFYTVNITAVVLVLAFILIVHIFGYGAELQRESDETV